MKVPICVLIAVVNNLELFGNYHVKIFLEGTRDTPEEVRYSLATAENLVSGYLQGLLLSYREFKEILMNIYDNTTDGINQFYNDLWIEEEDILYSNKRNDHQLLVNELYTNMIKVYNLRKKSLKGMNPNENFNSIILSSRSYFPEGLFSMFNMKYDKITSCGVNMTMSLRLYALIKVRKTLK